MGTIRVETVIKAPIERCFDLARSVEAHIASTAKTAERVVDGRKQGLFELGESVTWEVGRVADRLVVERYLRRLLTERAAFLKAAAEAAG